MGYQHQLTAGSCDLPVGKVVCVGRNYAEHARELNNPLPDEPLLFIKPSTAIQPMQQAIVIPEGRGGLHYETEVAVLIGAPLTRATQAEASAAITGVGLALDLTLRDLQTSLKNKGLPWEKAKAFDGSCCLSPFVAANTVNLQSLPVKLWINDVLRQDGNTDQMLRSVTALVAHISEWFTLLPGDVVLTGTPAGVGELQAGDQLNLQLGDMLSAATRVEN
ncbi:Fumarylacetoacetate hydrolase family protein [Nitrincola lacisaponensis]|uniref:Fumarylacetoacetate hydrolase family protein n=1 Tax=Nitrincola lacisaponensis TaxID=267850 RepID=A0A063Y672_9GAMM|nr:fumarylacetoacetate hydrolase family protein [Nitrincola lacisaponensis]KDE40251.1 Fumarylacetoacetate hydrolase family protein [Nitrincola lacisaponensis]